MGEFTEKPKSERTIVITPAFAPSAITSIELLESLREQKVEINDLIGYGTGGAVFALFGMGKTKEEILEALNTYPKLEEHMDVYLGKKTFREFRDETGINLMIQTTQINPEGTESALIFSADNEFADLPIARACKASSTLKTPLGVMGQKSKGKAVFKFSHNGIKYKCCDGNKTSKEIPKLIELDKYGNSILATMNLPIHTFFEGLGKVLGSKKISQLGRSKRIKGLMNCKIVYQPNVSFRDAIPLERLSPKRRRKVIEDIGKKGKKEIGRQVGKGAFAKINRVEKEKVMEVPKMQLDIHKYLAFVHRDRIKGIEKPIVK